MGSARLKGQRAVLIGASAGIGLETAKRLSSEGAALVLASRNMERLEAATRDIPGVVARKQVDATDEAQLAAFFQSLESFDHLSTFVPAAADAAMSAKFGRFLDMDLALIQRVMTNRFWSHCFAARHGAAKLKPGGSIVFVSSTMPRKAIPGYAASSAAAGALESLARVLAIELAPVRVNVVVPGFIASHGTENIPEERKAQWARLVSAQGVKRLGTSEEIADAILFLMSNAYTTGALLSVDGGYTLT
jgi:NAD(P)-dependent dehydrogenase (short-subunit alcohol dehydrogenase family)